MRIVTAWAIWGALLIGQLAFWFVIVFVIWPQQQHRRQEMGVEGGESGIERIFFYCGIGMLVACVLVGYVMRRIIYGRRLANGLIDPAKYVSGNIIFWGVCEGAGMFGLMVMLMAGRWWPYAIVPLVAMIVYIVNYPKGDEIRVKA